MTKTYEEVFTFIQNASRWLNDHKDETKAHYALRKVTKQCTKLSNMYQEEVEEININNCSVDEKGIILRDERGEYKFTKEGLINRNKKRRELFNSYIKIEPHYVKDTSMFAESEKENFVDFVIEAETKET